jgi:formylmethanofuran:tetrahydromethanopterin formyltransferase
MEINGVEIQDTFAEAFGIQVSRLLVTAATKKLAKIAALKQQDTNIRYWIPAGRN